MFIEKMIWSARPVVLWKGSILLYIPPMKNRFHFHQGYLTRVGSQNRHISTQQHRNITHSSNLLVFNLLRTTIPIEDNLKAYCIRIPAYAGMTTSYLKPSMLQPHLDAGFIIIYNIFIGPSADNILFT
jgi:hypothetical protein